MFVNVHREAMKERVHATARNDERVVERTGAAYPCRGSASAVVSDRNIFTHPNSCGTERYLGAPGKHSMVPGAARRSTGGAFGRFTSARRADHASHGKEVNQEGGPQKRRPQVNHS